MVLDQTSAAFGTTRRIVIDDRSRLPGRFFGRFATSATSALTRAAWRCADVRCLRVSAL